MSSPRIIPSRLNWSEIQRYYDAGNGYETCRKRFGFASSTWVRGARLGKIKLDPQRALIKKPIQQGQRFGRLVVLQCIGSKEINGKRGHWWRCQCDCGGYTDVLAGDLNAGHKKSCGCLQRPSGPEHAGWKGHGEIGAGYWGQLRNQCVRGKKRRVIDFDITIEYAWQLFLDQNRRCAISGVPLEMIEFRHKKITRTASLDRIDPIKGYIKGNIQWVHKDINAMKLDHSQQNFLNWIDTIYHFQHHI